MREQIFSGICVLHGVHEMHIGSLLYYYKSDNAINFRCEEIQYAFILRYKFLRVLDLGNVRLGSCADRSDFVNIAKLVHLRYLAIGVNTHEIPSEIGNLQNLETFFITGALCEVILPEAIWTLASWRHMLINNFSSVLNIIVKTFFRTSPSWKI
ncbi:hypothetical protein ACH5RR_002948 [Cinchona calisaya]|uniref:Disease resistance R13L4/SHOC-2-like LRR domain-containing protein n=1 Tax=Cinchona calisaya TaxID=153742 RepID=A0ABD3ATE4_9GENT